MKCAGCSNPFSSCLVQGLDIKHAGLLQRDQESRLCNMTVRGVQGYENCFAEDVQNSQHRPFSKRHRPNRNSDYRLLVGPNVSRWGESVWGGGGGTGSDGRHPAHGEAFGPQYPKGVGGSYGLPTCTASHLWSLAFTHTTLQNVEYGENFDRSMNSAPLESTGTSPAASN